MFSSRGMLSVRDINKGLQTAVSHLLVSARQGRGWGGGVGGGQGVCSAPGHEAMAQSLKDSGSRMGRSGASCGFKARWSTSSEVCRFGNIDSLHLQLKWPGNSSSEAARRSAEQRVSKALANHHSQIRKFSTGQGTLHGPRTGFHLSA